MAHARAHPAPPTAVEVRGVRHNTLQGLDVDIPLNRLVGARTPQHGGRMSSVLTALRLAMSRLGEHRCPNGHMVPPGTHSFSETTTCPTCGVQFPTPGAESFAFNSGGACPGCDAVGQRFEISVDSLVPDHDRTIEGAVLPWNSGGMRLSRYAARQPGRRPG